MAEHFSGHVFCGTLFHGAPIKRGYVKGGISQIYPFIRPAYQLGLSRDSATSHPKMLNTPQKNILYIYIYILNKKYNKIPPPSPPQKKTHTHKTIPPPKKKHTHKNIDPYDSATVGWSFAARFEAPALVASWLARSEPASKALPRVSLMPTSCRTLQHVSGKNK